MFRSLYFIVVVFSLLAISFSSCSSRIPEYEKNKVLIGQYYEALNLGNSELAEKMFDDHFVEYTNNKKAEKFGPALFLEEIGMNKENNLDYIYHVENMIAEGNNVVVKWEWNSTETTNGSPVSVSYQGVSIFTIDNGKITKLEKVFNSLEYNEQIGYKLMPPVTKKK